MRTRSSERFVCLWTRVRDASVIRSDDHADRAVEPGGPGASSSTLGAGTRGGRAGPRAGGRGTDGKTTDDDTIGSDPSHAGERGPGSGDRGATLHPSRLAQPCEPGPGPSRGSVCGSARRARTRSGVARVGRPRTDHGVRADKTCRAHSPPVSDRFSRYRRYGPRRTVASRKPHGEERGGAGADRTCGSHINIQSRTNTGVVWCSCGCCAFFAR